MALAAGGRERLHSRGDGVVAEQLAVVVDENRLSVPATAIGEQQRVLAGVAGKAVAAPLLQEVDDLLVATGGFVEEGQPAFGRPRRWRGRGDLGDVVGGIARQQFAFAQIDDAAWRSE